MTRPPSIRRSNGRTVRSRHMVVSAMILSGLLSLIAVFIWITAGSERVNVSFSGLTDALTITTLDQPVQPYVIRLPAANLIYEDPDRDFELVSRPLTGTASLVIDGVGILDFSSPGPGSLNVRAELAGELDRRREDAPELRLYDETGLVHVSSDPVDLTVVCSEDSCPAIGSADFLLQAQRATIGRNLFEWIEPETAGSAAYRQVGLEDGLVEAYLPAAVYGTRFRLGETKIEPGDVLELVGIEPIVGSVSIDFMQQERGRIAVVAYTRAEQLAVRRFGGGYTFGISRFTALSQQPFAQLLWLTLVSVLIIVSAWATLTELVSGFRPARTITAVKPPPAEPDAPGEGNEGNEGDRHEPS